MSIAPTQTTNPIKQVRQWLVWQDKTAPTSALTGKRAGWQRNLASYHEAKQFCDDHEGYNLGFCFSSDSNFVGLDLDSCRREDGTLEQWALSIITQLPNPIVFNNSVSGTGVKLIFSCPKAVKRGVKFFENVQQHGNHTPQVELMTCSKYFALTSPLEINEGHEVSAETLSRIMGFDVAEAEEAQTSDAVPVRHHLSNYGNYYASSMFFSLMLAKIGSRFYRQATTPQREAMRARRFSLSGVLEMLSNGTRLTLIEIGTHRT